MFEKKDMKHGGFQLISTRDDEITGDGRVLSKQGAVNT
jgi:hypothetical protein